MGGGGLDDTNRPSNYTLKSGRKTQGRLRLSHKNPDFFRTFRALQDFSKMTGFMWVDGRDFYQF